jgi:hypothetical protein
MALLIQYHLKHPDMRTLSNFLLVFLLCFITTAASANLSADSLAIEGRWDITVNIDGSEKPSWLEVSHSGFRTWVGRFVAVVGSARPVSKITMKGNQFSFAIPPQWEQGTNDL